MNLEQKNDDVHLALTFRTIKNVTNMIFRLFGDFFLPLHIISSVMHIFKFYLPAKYSTLG